MKETKLQELERRILELEKNRIVVIQQPNYIPPYTPIIQQRCTCHDYYPQGTPTRPQCPLHPYGQNYPITTC